MYYLLEKNKEKKKEKTEQTNESGLKPGTATSRVKFLGC